MGGAANDDDSKGQLAQLTKDHKALAAAHEKLTADHEDRGKLLDDAVAAQKAAVAERDDLAAKLQVEVEAHAATAADRDRASDAAGSVQRERDALAEKVSDLTAKLADAKKAPKVSRGPKSPVARKAASMVFGEGEEKPDAQELLRRLRERPHSIVLSDGQREILEVEPIVATADAFQPGPGGLMLIEPVKVKPDRPIEIRGYALLDEDGTQAGWGAPVSPIKVPANQEIEFRREFVF